MQAACRLHAAFMQPATSCMQDAATCNLLHTIVCRLHEACMKPACRLPPPACSLLQPATSCNLLHTIVFTKSATNRHNFSSTLTCRASTPTCRALTPCTPASNCPSNQSEFHDVASCSLCTFDSLVTFTTVEQLFTIVNSTDAQIATLNFLSQSRQANCFSLN